MRKGQNESQASLARELIRGWQSRGGLSLQQHQVHAQQAPQERRGQELLVDVFARPLGAIITQGRGEVESAGARSDTRASG